MKKFLILILFCISTVCIHAQNANSFSSVVPYSGPFKYGMNPGWWGTQFTNPQLGQLAVNAGSNSFRINLADYISGPSNGTGFNSDLAGYAAVGLNTNVGFLGSVWSNNQLDSTFPGCSQNSLIWRGTYQPIWTDSVNGVIDTANRFANYVYQMVTNAGSSIKFWEIINEIDFTGNTAAAGANTFNVTLNKQDTSSWWNVPPAPNDLVNFKAPIFYYIHMLKIAYSVIKRLQPNSYVAIGGIGYPATLDVLLRYTDNPVDGSVTPQFPLTGGAYFDVINFHTYPMYNLTSWNNSCNCFNYYRYSDRMIDVDTMYFHQYDSVQMAHGYNNNTYPKKIYISTETDAPQDSLDDGQWGSLPSAINYTLKWTIACQAAGLKQLDKYALGSMPLSNTSSEFNHCGLYGDITPATTTVANAPKTQEFYGYKTMTSLLYGKAYDPVKTAAMNIPANIRGYAFNDGSGNYTYVMWAKTSIDLSEGANATYTFPFAFTGTRMEWNYSLTDTTTTATQTVALTGFPSFFVASAVSAPVVNGGTVSGTTGTIFSYAITASNSPVSYAATGLPSGLTVNTSTGTISGTPTTAGTSVVTISATNAGGTGTNTLTITINPPAPVITSAGSASGTTGTTFSYTITASNTPVSYAATGLPSGLTVNTSTGTISGTPTTAGTSVVTISATNAGGTGTNTLTITINPPAPVITSAGSASGTTGTIFSYAITASNSPVSYTATGLPSGLTVNTSTGTISGTPTTAGTSVVTISATNAGGTGTNTLTITINPPAPVITSAGSASGTTGTTFSYAITASNSPVSYTATGLPSGLTVNTSTGTISGTPTTAGTSVVTISATNAGGTGTNTLTITINPPAPVITSAGSASGTTGTTFSYAITASNSPVSYTATGLPSGLTVNTSTGTISGTPTTAGTSVVTISATNAGGTGTNTLTITINPPAPVITSAGSAGGTTGTTFSYAITASNTPGSYTATGLPSGLTVNTSTGTISGTPTTAGTSVVTISATNAGGTGTNTLTITINPPAPVITSAGSASGTTGTIFSYAITASNSPVSYTATGLPSGLTVNTSTGTISGTPTTAGTSVVTISATNAGGTGTNTLTITINPPAPVITSAGSAGGTTGTTFSYAITASNSPGSYAATGLPSGLTVNTSTGTISGTPTTAGTSVVTISATNAGGTGTNTLTITINPPAPVITSAGSASGTTGTTFSYTITASNSPTGYAATGLPSGLTVNTSTGTISGTPTTAGTSVVTISATNAGGTGTNTLTITINPPAPVITSAGSAGGTTGTTFSYAITASNSPGSYTATGLPSGLTVNTSTGTISGTPTTAGTSVVTISATNAGGTGTNTLTITINPPAPVITSAGSAGGTTGTTFSYAITASNTPGSYTATGLPSGLTVNTSTGTISGTPTTAGTSVVTISATNAGGTGTNTLTITINPPAPVITSAGSAGGTTGTTFSYAITASNTPGSYTATGLPSGLTVNTSTGTISGTPTTAGTSVVTISATNAGGTGTNTLTITINPPAPVITSAGSASGTTGTIFSYAITASNSPVSYTATGLPSGLTVNTSTGTISGTPTTAGTSVVTISATNAGGTGTNTLTITINPPAPVITSAGSAGGTTGTTFSYAITASNSPVSYTATGLPSGLTVNTSTGTISGTPTTAGTSVVTISATNAGGTGTAILQITILSVNIPPVADAGADQTITLPTNSISLSGNGSDANGTITSYLWTQLSGPSIATITNAASPGTEVSGLIEGIYQFVLTVTDNNGLSAGDTVQVTVNAANIPPTANAGPDQVVVLPINSVTLNGSGTDANGTIVSYQWSQLSGPSSATIVNATSASTLVTNLVQGIYQFTLAVTDNNGATGLDTVQVKVNTPPVANAGTNQTITLPVDSITLNGSGADVDGIIVSYQWVQSSGPSLATIVNVASASTKVTNLVQGIYQFTLTLTDNNGATGSATVQVTVNAASTPPIANGGADQVVVLPTNNVTLNGSGTDANGTIVSYQWVEVSGPSSASTTDANSADITIAGLVQGVYQFALTVTNNVGLTASDTVQVTVDAARIVTVSSSTPVANAGTNQVITLPASSTTLSGSATDSGATITSYEWLQISGPSNSTISNANSAQTSVTDLVQGVYLYQLTVTDNNGAEASDTVQVTVNAAQSLEVTAAPNPVQTILTAQISNIYPLNQTLAVTVVNSNGTNVYSSTVNTSGSSQSVTINVSKFVSGIYMLNVRSTGKSKFNVTKKIIKK